MPKRTDTHTRTGDAPPLNDAPNDGAVSLDDAVRTVRAYLTGADTGNEYADANKAAEGVVVVDRLFAVLGFDPHATSYGVTAAALDDVADAWARAVLNDSMYPVAFRFTVKRATQEGPEAEGIGGMVGHKVGEVVAGFVTDEAGDGGRVVEPNMDFLPVSPAVAGKGSEAVLAAVLARCDALRHTAASALNDAHRLNLLAVALLAGRVPVAWPDASIFAAPTN